MAAPVAQVNPVGFQEMPLMKVEIQPYFCDSFPLCIVERLCKAWAPLLCRQAGLKLVYNHPHPSQLRCELLYLRQIRGASTTGKVNSFARWRGWKGWCLCGIPWEAGKKVWPLCLGVDLWASCTLKQSSDEVQHRSGETKIGVMRREAGNQVVCVFQKVGAE